MDAVVKKMDKIKQLLSSGKIFFSDKYGRGIITLISRHGMSQIVLFLALPILVRLYSPDDMGRLGLVLSFISFSSVVISLRYEIAIVNARDISDAIQLSFLCLILTVIFSCFLSGVFVFLIKMNYFGFGNLSSNLWIAVFLMMFFTSVFQILRYYHLRFNNYKIIGSSILLQGFSKSFWQIFLGYLNFGCFGLIFGEMLGRCAGFLNMGKIFIRDVHIHRINVCDNLLENALVNRVYPLCVLPSSLIDILAFSMIVPILAQVYGLSIAGFFSLANRLVVFPASLVSSNVADIFYSKIADCKRENSSEIKKIFLVTAKQLFLVGIIPAIIAMVLSPIFFDKILGDKWHVVGIMVSIMVPWVFSQFVVSTVSRVIFVVGGQKFKLIYDGVSLVFSIGGIYLCGFMGLSPLVAVGVISFLHVLGYILYFLILFMVTTNFVKGNRVCVE